MPVNTTTTASTQPIAIPVGTVAIIAKTNLGRLFFLEYWGQRIKTSTTQLTTGINNNKTCTNLSCLLNHLPVESVQLRAPLIIRESTGPAKTNSLWNK